MNDIDIEHFAYLACDDAEEWNVGAIDVFDYDVAARFRRLYDTGFFFIYYDYLTFTNCKPLNRLCFIPSLFYSNHPETLFEDLALTVNHLIFNRDVCVTFFRGERDVNSKLIKRLCEMIPGTSIYNVDATDVLYKVAIST